MLESPSPQRHARHMTCWRVCHHSAMHVIWRVGHCQNMSPFLGGFWVWLISLGPKEKMYIIKIPPTPPCGGGGPPSLTFPAWLLRFGYFHIAPLKCILWLHVDFLKWKKRDMHHRRHHCHPPTPLSPTHPSFACGGGRWEVSQNRDNSVLTPDTLKSFLFLYSPNASSQQAFCTPQPPKAFQDPPPLKAF